MANRKSSILLLVIAVCLLLAPAAASALEAEQIRAAQTAEEAQLAAELELLIGEGNGVDDAYLAKHATRMQAAIIALRLQGELDNALAHEGTDTFKDAGRTGRYNHPILAYLKANPSLGWAGTGGGLFQPLEAISSQQLYKVLLEALGYRSGVDFEYAHTEPYAASKGLLKIAGTAELTNAHIATALVEALYAEPKDGGGSLFTALQAAGVIPPDASLPEQPEKTIKLGFSEALGNYFTDQDGMTLYFYAKDAADPNSCTAQCVENRPIFYEADIVVPASLDPDAFGEFVRDDGMKQTTYKGWPLYLFAGDHAPGETKSEGAGGQWFAAKPDYRVMIGSNEALGRYLTDDFGRTLYRYDRDQPDQSVCTGPCMTDWLPYGAAGSAPSGLEAGAFGSIKRSDGTTQLTFNGSPLYYYVKDAAIGDTSGHGKDDVWHVVDPDKLPEAE